MMLGLLHSQTPHPWLARHGLGEPLGIGIDQEYAAGP
jgi:hypothetical protein